MRIAGLILGILGALAAGFLGMTWISDYNANKELIDRLGQLGSSPALEELERARMAAYILLGSLVAGLIGAVLALRGQGRIAAALMVLGALAPVIFAPKALVFTSLLIIAAIISFFAKPKARAAEQANLSSATH